MPLANESLTTATERNLPFSTCLRNFFAPVVSIRVSNNPGEGEWSVMNRLERREHRVSIPGALTELSWNGSARDILIHGQRVGCLNELHLSDGDDDLKNVADALGLKSTDA